MYVTDKKIKDFAELTGDNNPVHLDDEYAENSRFKNRIAHGFLVGSLISAKIAEMYPGCVYITQKMRFKRPVYIGDDVIAKVTPIDQVGNKLELRTKVVNQYNKTVIDGEALILL